MKKLFLIPLILTVACGVIKPKHKTKPDPRLQQLSDKTVIYSENNRNHLDSYGFVLSDTCDSLLFTGLLASTNNISVQIEAARADDGEWFRRPLNDPCDPSLSSISKDMYTGLIFYAWRQKRLDIVEGIWEYGITHNWIMGPGDLSKTFITPSLEATLAEVIYRLGGEDHIERNIPQVWTDNTDFEAHLEVLAIILRGELIGSINDIMKNTLGVQYGRNPRNALYSYAYHKYADGNQGPTLDILLDTSLFPSDKLPTTDNYCTNWLWQREYLNGTNPDWLPCSGNEEHSGGDWLFVAGLLN